MSVRQTNDVVVTCPNGHHITIPKDEWEYEEVERNDKSRHGMGVETHHRYSIEGSTCTQPGCSASIDATVDIWEYPEGTLETADKSENVVSNVGNCFAVQLD